MPCNPKCHFSASMDLDGNRLMISAGGKSKFPLNVVHKMCDECAKGMLEEAELGIMFNNDQGMIERYKKLKKNGHEN